jgi:tetratricopeptide (TPR) repeat protein
MPRVERLDSARHHALRAVALDGSLARSQAILGAVHFNHYEFQEAEQALRRALELDPGLTLAHQVLVQLNIFAGRFTDALDQALIGYERDPASSDAKVEVARAYLVNRDCDSALAWVDSLANVRPPLLLARNIEMDCLSERGQWEEAIAAIRRNTPAAGSLGLATLGNTLARAARESGSVADPELSGLRAERSAEARAILDTLLDRASRGEATSYDVATVLSGLGEVGLALDWLEKAARERSLTVMIMHPRFEPLHREPRFRALLASIGLNQR